MTNLLEKHHRWPWLNHRKRSLKAQLGVLHAARDAWRARAYYAESRLSRFMLDRDARPATPEDINRLIAVMRENWQIRSRGLEGRDERAVTLRMTGEMFQAVKDAYLFGPQILNSITESLMHEFRIAIMKEVDNA